MRFDQSVVREIHARTDIASYIGQYVSLRKRGNDLVGLCPFHSEKTPSFHVHPDRGFFKCFGCGAGGDVISFAQKFENLPFGDAVRMLAAKAGVAVEAETPGSARARTEREAIYEANVVAAAFFERMLRDAGGSQARAYAEQRGFSQATIERFHLGFAPDTWDALVVELQRHGVDLVLAEKAGLVKQGQRGYYDFYRNRLMVPTYATTGEIVAFGGRALGDAEPKYLNTTSTPVYTKGKFLFALNIARRAAQGDRTIIVVEGYLDCIALHQAGFENAVAALGTSFTAEQATELHKYADRVFLCFDGDAAGNSAAHKSVEVAATSIENAGTNVRVVELPPGDDPDSFVKKNGAPSFAALLDAAKTSIEFQLDPQLERLAEGFESPAKVARAAMGLIARLAPREEWDRWLVYAAGRLKVNVADLRNSPFLADGANFAPRSNAAAPTASRHLPRGIEPVSFEREILGILLEEPSLAVDFRGRIVPERFRNDTYRRIYATIVEFAERLREAGDVFSLFAEDQESHDILTGLGRRDRSPAIRYEDVSARRAHLERIVERFELDDERRRYRELARRIDDLIAKGEPVAADLRGEYEALVAKLKK